MRSALGVGRLALFRQVSVESLLLAALGGGCGIGLAFGIIKVFKLIGGHAIPRLDAVTAGWPVLACGLGTALFAAALAGLFPAVRATRLDPIAVLKSAGPNSSAGRRERRLLRAVTMVQTALTLALLVGAGLLIRTMSNLASVQSGYSTEHVLTMTVTAVQGDWADFHQRALERVSSVPGIQQAAFAWGVPLTGNNWPGMVEIEGRPVTKPADRIAVPLRSVTPGYFSILGLTIAEGRDFRSSDTRNAPGVAIVNQSLVDRYFGRLQPDRQEALDARTAAAADRSHRRGHQRPHRRSHARRGAGDLPVALAGDGVFEGPRRSRGGRSAVGRDGRPAGVARGRPDGRRRERQDAGADSRRFAGIAQLRHAVAGRVLAGGKPAHSGRHLRRAVALRRRAAPRDRHSRRDRRPASRTFETWSSPTACDSSPAVWLTGVAAAVVLSRVLRASCSRSSRPIQPRWPASGCCSLPSRCSPAGCRRAAPRRWTRWKRCAPSRNRSTIHNLQFTNCEL